MSSEIMTKDQQRIAVAEACGWRKVYTGPIADGQVDDRYVVGERYASVKNMPDYHEDANAQFEAWRGLSTIELRAFDAALEDVSDREGVHSLTAFNLHFCEIFLRVKGKIK